VLVVDSDEGSGTGGDPLLRIDGECVRERAQSVIEEGCCAFHDSAQPSVFVLVYRVRRLDDADQIPHDAPLRIVEGERR
jgi:hypothetical protein